VAKNHRREYSWQRILLSCELPQLGFNRSDAEMQISDADVVGGKLLSRLQPSELKQAINVPEHFAPLIPHHFSDHDGDIVQAEVNRARPHRNAIQLRAFEMARVAIFFSADR
jgi:hypothetical protein